MASAESSASSKSDQSSCREPWWSSIRTPCASGGVGEGSIVPRHSFDARAGGFFPVCGEFVIPHAATTASNAALPASELELEPDPVPHPDAVREESLGVPVLGAIRVSIHPEQPEAEPLVEAENVEVRSRESDDEPLDGSFPEPGDRPRNQPRPEPLPSTAGEHREAPELADPW